MPREVYLEERVVDGTCHWLYPIMWCHVTGHVSVVHVHPLTFNSSSLLCCWVPRDVYNKGRRDGVSGDRWKSVGYKRERENKVWPLKCPSSISVSIWKTNECPTPWVWSISNLGIEALELLYTYIIVLYMCT